MRVVAVQLNVTDDVEENLRTCLRLIDQAEAECAPDLIVLPEYCNHPPAYRNAEHCFEVSEPEDSNFLSAISAKAKKLGCMIQVNVTTRHRNNAVKNTNTMFGPDGGKMGESNKQFLIAGENFFMEKPDVPTEIMETPFGNIGMYSCMDGVTFEVTRSLALRGAQLLSNSLCSFAPDEDWLHLPVRAAENKCFVVAANKVGRLVPDGLLEAIAGDGDTEDARQMMGGGASQIVAPDGTVLAHAPIETEAIIWADIDLKDASLKGRPDGSDIFADRRPALYAPIVSAPETRNYVEGAAQIEAGVWGGGAGDSIDHPIDHAVAAVQSALKNGVQILSLPELAFLAGGEVTDVATDVKTSVRGVEQIANILAKEGSDTLVATSIPHRDGDNVFHQGILIGRGGIQLRQNTLHCCGRHPWVTANGSEIQTLDTKMARFAVVAGGDAVIPESLRLVALKDVEVVAIPTQILESWEVKTGFLERAAENRLSLVVATRLSPAGTGLIVTLDRDFTQGTTREDGQRRTRTLSWPIAVHADRDAPLMRATIFPSASANRLCFIATDLVDGRPWHLAGAIASATPGG